MIDRRDLIGRGLAIGTLAAAAPVLAAPPVKPRRIALWPDGLQEPVPAGLTETLTERSKDPAVRDRALTGVAAPWLEHFRAARGNGAAIVVVPGGGYRHMAWDKEALEIAAWFARHGVAAFALAYRLPHEGWAGGLDTPLADAQRAMRLVRSRSKEFGIDPLRIAAVGFSAGGHLVANLAAQSAASAYSPQDAADALSARPDLVAPIYPAIDLQALTARMPAGEPLFGKPMSAADLTRHSPHLNARADTPPHFLLHAEDDPLVGPEHSLALRQALRIEMMLRVVAPSRSARSPCRKRAASRTPRSVFTESVFNR